MGGSSKISRRARRRVVEIDIARAEEGVWTATSADVPGLNVEGETPGEAVAEARIWAPELLRANGIITEDESIELVFSREGDRLAID